MLTVRRAVERGHAQHGWLESWHTFSFADYHDPRWMGFRHLRVINEDYIQPGRGFGTHAHQDMEIVTYVLAGTLEHRDSMGNGSLIRPHEVQRMSAGTGVTHSEFNASPSELVHLLQIWILPEQRSLSPGYEQRAFAPAEARGRLRPIAARDGGGGAVTIHQDVTVLVVLLDGGEPVVHALASGRHAWVQVARGEVVVNGVRLATGDGAAISDEARVDVGADGAAEVLLFDLA